MYNGQVGMVQTNQSDFIFTPIFYPLYDPETKHFSYSDPLTSEQMMIGSIYNYSANLESRDLLDAIQSFGPDFASSAMASFILLSFILLIGQRLSSYLKISNDMLIEDRMDRMKRIGVRQKNNLWRKHVKYKLDKLSASKSEKYSPFWLIFRAILDEDNFPLHDAFHKIFAISAVTYLFFLFNYMTNSISTDLVVSKDPKVIASYQDIIDNDCKILWTTNLAEYSLFQNSHENSIERKLWNRRIFLQLKGNFFNMDQASEYSKGFLYQTTVGILRDSLIRWLVALGSMIAKEAGYDFGGIKALLSIDPISKSYGRAFIFGHSIDPFINNIINER